MNTLKKLSVVLCSIVICATIIPVTAGIAAEPNDISGNTDEYDEEEEMRLYLEYIESLLTDEIDYTEDDEYDEELSQWTGASIYQTIPASVTGERSQGAGTLVDYVITGYRHFLTIRTREDTILYVIIDYDKEDDNVYFLTAVDRDMLEYIEAVEAGEEYVRTERVRPSQQQQQQYDEYDYEPEFDEEEENEGFLASLGRRLLPVLLVFVAVGGGGWYFKIYKKKPKTVKSNEDVTPVNTDDIEISEDDDFDNL